jgi:hypothetical protein
MGFMEKLLRLKPLSVELLNAQIALGESHGYFILLKKCFAQTPRSELVQTFLHYYAQVLYLITPSPATASPSTDYLTDMMDTILAKGIHPDTNILQSAGIRESVTMMSTPPKKGAPKIEAKLFFLTPPQRRMTLKLQGPVDERRLTYSVIALLKALLPETDADSLSLLNRALEKMQSAYRSGRSCADPKNLIDIPTEAFNSSQVTK